MPSQITHYLFADEAIRKALGGIGGDLAETFPEIVAWCAQGPDVFYHNQRTQPAAFKYGRILHRSGYGTLTGNMVRHVFSRTGVSSEIKKAYITAVCAFVTHAVLDRATHPFIIYFSGWREPGDPDSMDRYKMHPFFERIIDIIVYADRRGTRKEIFSFDFYALISRIERHIGFIGTMMLESIEKSYPNLNKPDLDAQRFHNAYHDAIFFYRATNPADRENALHAYRRDRDLGFTRRILALYYPRHLDPAVDFGNGSRGAWTSPFDETKRCTASIIDLYEDALETSVPVIRRMYDLLNRGAAGEEDIDNLAEIVGNGNLSDGGTDKNPAPVHSKPLPLYRHLVREYVETEKEFGLDQVFIDEEPV